MIVHTPNPHRAVALIMTALLCVAGAAHGAPPTDPSETGARPQYRSNGTGNTQQNRPIVVQWKDNSGDETKFEIERSTDGATFAKIGEVTAGTTTYTDNANKDSTKTYSYRVRAVNDDGNSGYSAVFATKIAVTWPVNVATKSHQMLTGFADGDPGKNFSRGFHEGIDVSVDGKGGHPVVVARAGKIVVNNADNGGMITVEVDVPGGHEYDSYLHISDRSAKAVNSIVAEGESIGKISKTHYSGEPKHHLHFDVAVSSSPGRSDMRNPFMRFTVVADRDPLENTPALEDTNGDGKKLLIAKSGKTTPPGNLDTFDKQTIKGDVDIIADARDKMSDSLKGPGAPHKIGYHVKALFDRGVPKHDVRTAASPYLLAKFDDNWFPGVPGGAGGNDRTLFKKVYADDGSDGNVTQDLRVKPNPTGFPAAMHYIVTNTKDDTGRPNKVDDDQYWNTNAKDDTNIADTNDAANFAGKPDAGKNANARFKDGEYEVHIVLGDLKTATVDETAGKLRLDNFKQTAAPKKCGGCAAPATGATAPLYDPANTTPWVPQFTPVTQVAGIDAIFVVGDTIGIEGDQYYGNLVMPSHVFTHKAGWNEDDALTGGIANPLVKSGATGAVPLTQAWTIDRIGRFDVLIDYDRDAKFSWTLDGLGGFKVVPRPVKPVGLTTVEAHLEGTLTNAWTGQGDVPVTLQLQPVDSNDGHTLILIDEQVVPDPSGQDTVQTELADMSVSGGAFAIGNFFDVSIRIGLDSGFMPGLPASMGQMQELIAPPNGQLDEGPTVAFYDVFLDVWVDTNLDGQVDLGEVVRSPDALRFDSIFDQLPPVIADFQSLGVVDGHDPSLGTFDAFVDPNRLLQMHVVDFNGQLGPVHMLLDPTSFNMFRVVPEPGSAVMLLGAALIAAARRRR